MREKILLNQDWNILVNPTPTPEVKSKAGMYIAAKTERLKWGPGTYQHQDNFNFWSFTHELNPEPWEKVNLPHDYIISQTPDPHQSGPLGFFNYVDAWYRKHLTFTDADRGKRITVYFEGITGIADIYLNGCFLRHHQGSYDSFDVDLTDLVRFGEDNVLAVHVNPNDYEGWWYAGGGIYRNVWLEKTDPIAVDRWGAFLPVRKQEDNTWNIPLEVTVRNDGFLECDVHMSCQILDPCGDCVATLNATASLPPRQLTTLNAETTLRNPDLWNVGNPRLYRAVITLTKQGVPCDRYSQTFGFRTIQLTADQGLLVNGNPIKIKGVCAHLDCGLTGKAVPDNLCRYKVQLIRDMGANALRTSHYPHQEATMDACDQMGLLVLDETRRFESNDTAMEQLRMMVRRDRNRPSVFLWSTGNEETQYHSLPQGFNIHRAMEFEIHRLDPTRMVTTCISNPATSTIQEHLQVIGINYNLDQVDRFHQLYPNTPILGTENCAVPSSRGVAFETSTSSGRFSARDTIAPEGSWAYGREQTWNFFQQRPWNAGTFQWDAFEHRGEAIWPRLCSVSGAIDLFLQKKDAFYQNQSHWLSQPMVHILPHWNHHGLEGVNVNLWIYTNCQQVQLKLNETIIGTQEAQTGKHLEWNLPYQPGKLEAVAFIDGKPVARHILQTAGKPENLKLTLDTPDLTLNGQDVAILTCTVLDADGIPVPDASPTVSFDCTGDGTIVGTGSDITDHTPLPSLTRSMYAGRIGVAVRTSTTSTQPQPQFTLYARAEGLAAARLNVMLKFP